MKPFRKQVAIAIDGGGIRGVIPARALSVLENHLGQPSREIFQLAAGTSTGAIISAGIGAGLTGVALHRLYTQLGGAVFCRSWRTWLWPLTRYRYPHEPLESALRRLKQLSKNAYDCVQFHQIEESRLLDGICIIV